MTIDPGTPDGGPYPDPRRALLLTLGAILSTGLVGVFFFDLGAMAAIGIGHAIAVGAIATFAAKRVAEPQADRIGLRGFDPQALPILLCLVPAVLLASELDNFATDWSAPQTENTARFDFEAPASDAFEATVPEENEAQASQAPEPSEPTQAPELDIDLSDPWTLAQAFVIYVGIAPVVEEFFFRGVLQQSLIARLGLNRGVAFVALLYTLFHLPAMPVLPRFLLGVIASFGMGCLLGLVRVATGSLLGPIVLASSWAAIGIASIALENRLPLPGMNVDDTHLPITVAIASLALVIWALRAVYGEAEQRLEREDFGS
jgi:membrane protease YdiL (CAAX protease family)